MGEYEKAKEAAEYLKSQSETIPKIAIICGSGLQNFVSCLNTDDAVYKEVPYEAIPHFKIPTVQGHAGKIVIATIGSERTPILCVSGRLHTYEGYDIKDTVFSVRVMAVLGVKTLIVTNAAGHVNPEYETGDMMVISDHINFPGMAGLNPLKGPNEDEFGERFPVVKSAYSHELRHKLWTVAQKLQLSHTLREGVYAFVSGPNFETAAEVRYLRAVGVDAVGMSTVPEVIVAAHSGIDVLGISVCTNIAWSEPPTAMQEPTNVAPELHGHEYVLEQGRLAAADMEALITALVPELN